MLLALQLNNLLGEAPTLVLVPDVVGETQAQGTIDLQAVLFTVVVNTAYSSSVPAGKIISQSPLGGTQAVEGSAVTITVSLGDVAANNSGGFFFDYEAERDRRHRRRQEQEERELEIEQIQQETDREIARLLRKQEAEDAERADLDRVQRIADQYAGTLVKAGLPRQVAATVIKAHEERTKNSLEQMRRELERLFDEEEMAILQLLLDD